MISTTSRLREDALSRQHATLRGQNDDRPSTMRLWARKKPQHDPDALLRNYAVAQIQQAVACSVTRMLRLVEAQVNSELERLQVFWKDLNTLAGKFHVSQSLDEAFACYGGSEIVPGHWRALLGELVSCRNELVEALDREMESTLAVGPKKLRWFLNEGPAIDTQLATPLRSAARQLILATMQDLNASRLGGNCEAAPDSPNYRSCIEAARPKLADQAAGTRILLMLPNDADAATLRQSLTAQCGQEATIVHSTDGDVIACQEGELLEVRRVAAKLIGNRRDFVEVAQRLYTRIDVSWDDMSASNKAPFADSCLSALAPSEVTK
jgi:hypothetical protein